MTTRTYRRGGNAARLAALVAAVALVPGGGWAADAEAAVPETTTASTQTQVERGEYLFHAGLCAACHTADDGKPMAGGRAIESPYGTFYSTNITPDPEYGIGGWSDEDFVRALREGVSPAGRDYYPAFPYPAFTKLSREDMLALKAYLDSIEPVAEANRGHELVWYASWRWPLTIWKWLFFEPGPWQPDKARSDEWNRGAYLSEAALHCAECHSPRNLLGAIDQDARYSGAADGIEGSGTPNITSDDETGIGRWNADTLAFYLEIGMDPSGDFAGGAMAKVVDLGTSKLSGDDRQAIAEYIVSLPPKRGAAPD